MILRKFYALKMMSLFEEGFHIFNIDETWIGETQYHNKEWKRRGKENPRAIKTVTPRLSLILALDTLGNKYFSLNQANTGSDIFVTFIRFLC